MNKKFAPPQDAPGTSPTGQRHVVPSSQHGVSPGLSAGFAPREAQGVETLDVSRGSFTIPLIALFLSGFGALVLEVVWTRIAILILGSTTVAATVVFATFMGGLALGAFTVARYLSTVRRPFLIYFAVELLTMLAAVLIAFAWQAWGASVLVPRVVVVVVLLVPTLCMGMTVPLVVRGLVGLHMAIDRASAWAYGINTVGGAVGALAGAFCLLPLWGLFSAQLIASGCLVGAAILSLFVVTVTSATLEETSPSTSDGRLSLKFLILAFAFWGGASSLSLEIVAMRLFALILGPSVYALGIVLFVYLLGIAVGASFCPSVLKRFSTKHSVAVCFSLLGFSVGWTIMVVGLLPYLFVWLVETFQPALSSLRLIEFLLSAIALGPAALLHGILLPLLMAHYPDQEVRGRPAALAIGWNTGGAIVGVILTGLVAIPAFGFLPTLLVLAVVHVMIGVTYLYLSAPEVPLLLRRAKVALSLLFVVVFLVNAPNFWDQSVLTSGVYKYAVGDALGARKGQIEIGKILFYREGISSTVAVIETADDRVLSIDGKADASVYGDRSTQVLLGALPGSLAEKTDSFLVVGFASGVTAGVSSVFPGSRVTAVEIEPAVYEASKYFLSVNLGPLASPRHSMVTGDARRYLHATKETYDVITSEPSNPWMSGVAPLFTQEFFHLARARLRQGGVMCQWLPIYGMTKGLVASVMKTFRHVFPHVLVFESVEGFDLLLIGADHEIQLDPTSVEARWTNEELKRELKAIGIDSGLDLIARFLMGNRGISNFSAGAIINTDDNGFVEFAAPKALHVKTAGMNDKLLSEASEGMAPYLSNAAKRRQVRQALAERLKRRGELRLAELLLP